MAEHLGFGGSCHWCTEGIFRSLKGIHEVKQGWISSVAPYEKPSEAVLVTFDPEMISRTDLVRIHLHSHSCTNAHSMRAKYRSAVYTFNTDQKAAVEMDIEREQNEFKERIITLTLPFVSFKLNQEHFLDYYYKDVNKPFCRNNITPKFKELLSDFRVDFDPSKIRHLSVPTVSEMIE